ncbi:hypothetical protein ACFQZ4_51875 [Catellatospora coxensis]
MTLQMTKPVAVAPRRLTPDDVATRTTSHNSLRETVGQTMSMAWRATKKMRRNPEQFFDVTIQPLLFTAMFAYLLGGGLSGSVQAYLPLVIPGILAQTALTACMATGVQLREDMEKGCSTGSSRCRWPGSRRWPGPWSPTCCGTRSPRR